MGIYDRDYMDGTDESSFHRPGRLSALGLMIVVNAIVWIVWQFARNSEFMNANFTVSAYGVLHEYRIWTLFTAAISHIDLFHILFNMLFLWFLGDEVEQFYGYRNFLFLYFFAAVVASLAYVGFEVGTAPWEPMLGASGAVMGIVLVAAILNPNRQLYIWGVIPIRLKWLVAIYIAFDVLGMSSQNTADPVAHIAHLGGALAGFLFWRFDLRVFGRPRRESAGWWYRLKQWWRRRRWRVVEGRRQSVESPRPESPRGQIDAALSRRVDELLAKISREGLDSLTEEERRFLQQSSQKYKRPGRE